MQYSRKIMSYELSNSLNNSFCVTAVSNALMHIHPEIMNTDHGCQYTGMEFAGLLKSSVRISMDSRGRAPDKYSQSASGEHSSMNSSIAMSSQAPEICQSACLSLSVTTISRDTTTPQEVHRPASMRALRQKELPRNLGYLGELLIFDKGSTIEYC